MKNYNKEESQLRKWCKILDPQYPGSIKTNRIQTRQQLLDILNSQESSEIRLKKFESLRLQLCSEHHNQGFTWTEHFSWFSRLLRHLPTPLIQYIPASWLTSIQPGSQLRKALNTTLENDELIDLSTPSLALLPIIETCDFEEALFIAPQKIKADLNYRYAQLNHESVTAYLIRLEAAKERIHPGDYQQQLIEICKNFPKESYQYYYGLYKTGQLDDIAGNIYTTIAVNALATIVLSLTAFFYTETNPKLHTMIQLIIVLSQQKKGEFFDHLCHQFSLNQLITDYHTEQKILESHILDRCNDYQKIQLKLKHTQNNDAALGESVFDNPETLLQLAIDHKVLKKQLAIDKKSLDIPQLCPLTKALFMIAFERLAILQLSEPYAEHWHDEHIGANVLRFLTHPLFLNRKLSNTHHLEKLLDAMTMNVLELPLEFITRQQNAQKLTLFFAKEGILIEEALFIRQERHFTFNIDEVKWIRSHLTYFAPDSIPFHNKLAYVLHQLNIYDNNQYDKIPTQTHDMKALIHLITESLTLARKANNENNALMENDYSYKAVSAFKSLLNNAPTPLLLQQLHLQYLPDITPYLSHTLASTLTETIIQKIHSLAITNKKILERLSVAPVDNPFDAAEIHYNKAMKAYLNDSACDWENFIKEIQMSVYYFNSFSKAPLNTMLNDPPSLYFSLEPYTTPSIYQAWQRAYFPKNSVLKPIGLTQLSLFHYEQIPSTPISPFLTNDQQQKYE